MGIISFINHLFVSPFIVSLLTILDNIEITGGKSATILKDKFMKGIKKALPIVDLQVYGRAFIF